MKRIKETVINILIAVLVIAFFFGVLDSGALDATNAIAPANGSPPFNSWLFFGLLMGPVIIYLILFAVWSIIQVYRVSSSQRARGYDWEETS